MTNSSFSSQIVLYLSVTRKGGAFLYQNLRQHRTIELSPKQKKADLLQSALSKNSIYVRNKSSTSRTNHIFFARLLSHILISSIVCNGNFLPFANCERDIFAVIAFPVPSAPSAEARSKAEAAGPYGCRSFHRVFYGRYRWCL